MLNSSHCPICGSSVIYVWIKPYCTCGWNIVPAYRFSKQQLSSSSAGLFFCLLCSVGPWLFSAQKSSLSIGLLVWSPFTVVMLFQILRYRKSMLVLAKLAKEIPGERLCSGSHSPEESKLELDIHLKAVAIAKMERPRAVQRRVLTMLRSPRAWINAQEHKRLLSYGEMATGRILTQDFSFGRRAVFSRIQYEFQDLSGHKFTGQCYDWSFRLFENDAVLIFYDAGKPNESVPLEATYFTLDPQSATVKA